jgi:hypothetical protein
MGTAQRIRIVSPVTPQSEKKQEGSSPRPRTTFQKLDGTTAQQSFNNDF